MDIKNLELTENDFKLLVDGLDNLPNKDVAGEIMGELLIGMFDKSPEAQAKARAERETKKRMEQAKRDFLIEEIRILQGKLLLFKRWLIENDALKQVNDLLK